MKMQQKQKMNKRAFVAVLVIGAMLLPLATGVVYLVAYSISKSIQQNTQAEQKTNKAEPVVGGVVFLPQVKAVAVDQKIMVNVRASVPDGTIAKVNLLTQDAKKSFSQAIAFQGGSADTVILIGETTPKELKGIIVFDPSKDSQSLSVIDYFGENGSRLTGTNVFAYDAQGQEYKYTTDFFAITQDEKKG